MGSQPVRGVEVDAESRCAHYHGERDVVAIEFACCGEYYACYRCHRAVADHPAAVWPADQHHRSAVRCGVCEATLSIDDYVTGEDACPECGTGFNPGCADHYHLYFAV